jgi:uncharacterized protein
LKISASRKEKTMVAILSRKAALAKGALIVHLRPKLAADAAIDLTPILAGVTQANFGAKKAGILSGLRTELRGKLAKDADIEDITQLLDALEEAEEAEGMDVEPKPEANDDEPSNFLKKKMSAEDVATYDSLVAAKTAKDAGGEEDDEEKKKKKEAADKKAKDEAEKKDEEGKKAMDAAIATVTKSVRDQARKIRDAEKAVRAYVGDLEVACDSAEEVYRAALTAMGVDVKGVHADALPAILRAQPVPGVRRVETVLGMDSTTVKSFNDRYPDAARIRAL